MGILRINGTIDINQFWPLSSSDADTTKIKLLVNKSSFEYKADNATKFTKTKVYEDAISKGQGSKPVIKTYVKTGERVITVRLQGVDAPELHYKASPLKDLPDISQKERTKYNQINKTERRQPYAESSTVALANHLKKYSDANGLMEAVFETSVEFPFEAVDTYGRFVGNIIVSKQNDINIWLIENGWGQPGLYTSMSQEEITNIISAYEKGKKIKGRTASSTTLSVREFDWKMEYRKPPFKGKFKIGDDKGKVLMPKIFRRQVAWMISKKSGVLTNNAPFENHLKKSPDQLVLLKDFLENGVHAAKVYALHKFVKDFKVEKGPDEMVFKEKPGTLVNTNGKKLTKWK